MAFGEKAQVFQMSPNISLDDLAQGIEQFLVQSEGMVCQMFQTPDGISIQTRKKEDWKKYAMMDNAMQVNLTETGYYVNVQIGGAKWVDKAVASGLSAIVALPIALPLIAFSSIGFIGNVRLPDKILDFISQYIATDGANISIPQRGINYSYNATSDYVSPFNVQPQVEESVACPECGKLMPKSSRFCADCGSEISAALLLCPECGELLQENARFCAQCGHQLAE
ncbi:MAG: zinc ribbon domain-containing protein [Eubacteriaceae bacterium]|nr:zinc ribbon domain-containing protein [Eubacteriaceae bacterium]